jgi:hypothetical protein
MIGSYVRNLPTTIRIVSLLGGPISIDAESLLSYPAHTVTPQNTMMTANESRTTTSALLLERRAGI